MGVQPFTSGPPELVAKLNEMVRIINQLENMTGDGLVRVNQTTGGRSLSLNVDGLLQRLPKESAGSGGDTGGTLVNRAICQEDAPSGSVISCDIYGSSGVIESDADVTCLMSGGGDLNEASRRLEIGDSMFVTKVDDIWISVEGFQATEDCTCGS